MLNKHEQDTNFVPVGELHDGSRMRKSRLQRHVCPRLVHIDQVFYRHSSNVVRNARKLVRKEFIPLN